MPSFCLGMLIILGLSLFNWSPPVTYTPFTDPVANLSQPDLAGPGRGLPLCRRRGGMLRPLRRCRRLYPHGAAKGVWSGWVIVRHTECAAAGHHRDRARIAFLMAARGDRAGST